MISYQNKPYLVLVLVVGILTAFFVFDYINYMNARENESIDSGQESLREIQTEVVKILDDIVDEGKQIKDLIESKKLTKEEVTSLVESKSRDLYYLQGMTIAFEPNDGMTELFAPYYDKRRGKIIQLGEKYDYRSDSIETNEWYLGPIKKETSQWTDPYFATGAKLIVADYGLPFYLNEATAPSGVISLTLDLKKLGAKLDSLVIGHTGTSMIFSNSGALIAHPIPEFVLDITLQRISKELNMGEQVHQIMNNDSGYIKFVRRTGQNAFAFYSEIPNVHWKTLVTFNSDDLLGSADLLHRKLVKICLGASVLIFTILLFFVGVDSSNSKKMWYVSISISIIIIANIIVMWYLNLNYNYSHKGKKEVYIESRAGLKSFLNKENQKTQKLGLQRLIPVSTGIFIEEFEFQNAYNVSIRGEIWQKWPRNLARFYEADFRFPQEALTGRAQIEKISVEEDKKFITHTWSYKLILKMPFDYSKYPFDVRDLKIEMMYPNVGSGIILVPDVEGYSGLSPYSMPGINREIYLNDSKLLSSQFSFEIVNFHDRFGHQKFAGLNQYPMMKYTIHLKRRLLNVMVMNIIPILVVAAMIFLIFYSITRDKEDKSGVSMMGAVQSCAGFFFVLLVAHIDLRRRLSTPSLTYIESFYLTMYVIMALLVINVVAFIKGKESKFLHYQDNLLVKVSYWPVLLFTWMLITLFVFYS